MTMRVLVVGAGATGGYFGGRLLQAGRDVTFLVRPRRAAELTSAGLIIKSPKGDVTLREPKTVLSENIRAPFDLVLLSCKAYDLESAVDSVAPAVGNETMILPLLNGMKHLDVLDARFGREKVLGGLCAIAATLDAERVIVHLNTFHSLAFGERDGRPSNRISAVAGVIVGPGFDARASENIVQDMWEKWVLLGTLAGATCLMRAPVGDIVASPGGRDLILSLFEEIRGVAAFGGYAPRPAFLERTQAMLTETGSPFTASMLRDVEGNGPIEADHILGDLLHRRDPAGAKRNAMSVLQIAYAHLKTYEARRARTLASAASPAP
jgi:2-dehydropantoate 2-reductase